MDDSVEDSVLAVAWPDAVAAVALEAFDVLNGALRGVDPHCRDHRWRRVVVGPLRYHLLHYRRATLCADVVEAWRRSSKAWVESPWPPPASIWAMQGAGQESWLVEQGRGGLMEVRGGVLQIISGALCLQVPTTLVLALLQAHGMASTVVEKDAV